MTDDEAKLKTLRDEHFGIMVGMMEAWVHFHGDPAVVRRALDVAVAEAFKAVQVELNSRLE